MAYYALNALLALPTGECTCAKNHDTCQPCTINLHSARLKLTMSRWSSPTKRLDRHDAQVRELSKKTILVTIGEGKTVPDDMGALELEAFGTAESSRLTVFGHGDPKSETVGGRSPDDLAKLILVGCGITRVSKISLMACYGGGNFNTEPGKPGHVAPESSFAKQFHEELVRAVEGKQLFVPVTARTRSMVVTNDLRREANMGDQVLEYKAPNTKYVFEWVIPEGSEEKHQSWRVINSAAH